jgi:hypothetical protein
MRSLKEIDFLCVRKCDMIVGRYYTLHAGFDWIFRFCGFDELSGEIISDITYIKKFDGWIFFGDKVSVLCRDSDIDGDIRKCRGRYIEKKINL